MCAIGQNKGRRAFLVFGTRNNFVVSVNQLLASRPSLQYQTHTGEGKREIMKSRLVKLKLLAIAASLDEITLIFESLTYLPCLEIPSYKGAELFPANLLYDFGLSIGAPAKTRSKMMGLVGGHD